MQRRPGQLGIKIAATSGAIGGVRLDGTTVEFCRSLTLNGRVSAARGDGGAVSKRPVPGREGQQDYAPALVRFGPLISSRFASW